LDEIDLRILQILQKNARISVKALSEAVNLSSPAVGERLRKIERSGTIRAYAAVLDPLSFGKEFSCYCFVELSRHTPAIDGAFERFAREQPEILECRRITGGYEYILKIVCRTPKEVDKLIEVMRATRNVVNAKTYTILKDVKKEYSVFPE
jgi:Lrp/AsnC family leucine-responsive transcriptional regulator